MAFYGDPNVATGQASEVPMQPTRATSLPEDLTSYFLNFASPQTGYQAYLNQLGYNQSDPVSVYMQSQYNQAYQDWLLATAKNPGLGFTTFLKQSAPNQQEVGQQYLNYADPSAGFYKYLGQQGINSGTDPAMEYAKSQYSTTYNQYRAAEATSPGLGFSDYLGLTQPDFRAQYGNQSPYQRGINTNVSTPRVTWTM